MEVKYKIAWREGNTVLYMDVSDRKYSAKNGNLAWRINNPGLVKHHCHYARKNGSIGAWEKFAIFSNPLQGHQALRDWLHSKTMFQSDLYAVAKHYSSNSLEQFAQDLASSIGVALKTKLKDLTRAQFEVLIACIEKQCGFIRIGNEEFSLLPKIAAKIERSGKEDLYLIGQDLTLTYSEAIDWVNSHHLDAVIVRRSDGEAYLRSRPCYHMQTIKLTWEQHCETAGEIDILARVVGEKVTGQCVWGFINGIRNKKENVIESSNLISSIAENEEVIALKNDQLFFGAKEVGVSILLKLGIDTPIVRNAVQFLRYLLTLSDREEKTSPVIVFAHSQGAGIIEHALTLLTEQEKRKIRVFTFGGWSFISSDAAHPESHNYASVGDLIPRMGSFNSQYLAIKRYEGLKEGLSLEEIIHGLAFGDAIQQLDTLNPHILEKFTKDRSRYYRNEFEKISNVTVIDSESLWEHSFNNKSYQKIVRTIIKEYRTNTRNEQAVLDDSLAESYV